MNFDRGDLNGQKTAISGTPVREEDFSLDPTGNWTDYVQKTSGTTDLDQDRTHNQVNEITAITATVGNDWTDPVHDRSGNMTTLPKTVSAIARTVGLSRPTIYRVLGERRNGARHRSSVVPPPGV